MTRLLYSLLMWLVQPWVHRKLARRGVAEAGYLDAVPERFGHYTLSPEDADANVIWVHAVSLGETRAAAALVARLRARLPGMRLLLTHGTATGRAEGAQLLQAGDRQVWQPWDTPGAVRRFLQHFKPRIGILMETEVWPNLVASCAQMQLPLVLANARMSEKSARKAQLLGWLSRPALRALAAVWAQTEADATRLRRLGAPVTAVFGNLKFDATPDAAQLATGCAWRAAFGRSVLMFASSRAGEEQALLDLLATQRASGATSDSVQWLIVPRHPQRFDEVAALIASRGFAASRRSSWGAQPPASAANTIWLGDTLGEMALYYGLVDAALLGGSFEPLGGQNLIEAAACVCPLLMGPHTFNFEDAAELAESAGAALRMPDLPHAVNAAQQLLADPKALSAMADAASGFAAQHRGAVEKTVSAVIALLGASERQTGLR